MKTSIFENADEEIGIMQMTNELDWRDDKIEHQIKKKKTTLTKSFAKERRHNKKQ